ncbi:hypothetical protein KUCAC02_030442, partial [Chaenocephalus aceratus]
SRIGTANQPDIVVVDKQQKKGVDMKHPNRVGGTLFRLNTHSAWRSFKHHPVLIEDVDLRDRLTRLIESTSDPFANDIMYHHACWRKHVDSIIFTEREIRSLQSLLAEYKRIAGDYGYEVGDVKSSYVKGLLINEYQETIGFKERNQMNMSQWVYDVGGGGDYIEAAISFLGISDEQLLQNLAQRLSEKIKDTTTVPWPPRIDHLEEGEEVCELLLKLLTWLKQPERKTADISPATLSLTSMITYHITGQRTTTAINMGVNVQGMTRSTDLVETLHKSGVSISYADTLLLYDHWALMDRDASATCPQEIADSKPAIVIVDNDDFKIDTLTDNNGTRPPPPHEQQVPAYSGAQSCHHTPPNKSKPYYHTTYNEPPCKSVVYDIMVKLVEAMHKKNIPFSFLVGDLPTYKTTVQLKAENSEMYKDLIPILGAFHQQMSYIYAIYKRFKRSGMADTLED